MRKSAFICEKYFIITALCGINFILYKNKKADTTAIKQMNLRTLHRGRENSTIYVADYQKEQLHFGHNRLKIIDTSDISNQPFISEDGKYVLIFNGEIYNFQDFIPFLAEKNIKLKSHSDLQVLFHLLILEGEKCLEKLNGMFAFVFWNGETGELWAARDRSGMKPLYFVENENYLLFSSEIQGILAAGLVEKKLNEAQIPHYLRFKYARKPQTFFQNIYELEEGKWIRRLYNEKISIKSYLNPLQNKVSQGNLAEILTASIQRHLIADVPCGLFLSGGIDSTLLLAMIKAHNLGDVPTFSIINRPEDAAFGSEDYHYARLAAQKYGNAAHTEICVNPEIMVEIPDFVANMDQPIADSAAILTFLLSKEAAKSVKVVLSGAGADEWFAGYNRHWAFYRYLTQFRKFRFLFPALRKMGKLLPTGNEHFLRKSFQLFRKLSVSLYDSPSQTFAEFISLPGFRYLQSPDFPPFEVNNLADALSADIHQYLISDILMLNDVQCMRNTMEMRMPYLDVELTNYVAQIPANERIAKGRKYLLADLLRKYDGDIFVERKKEGFTFPFGKWIQAGKSQEIWDFLQKKDSPIFAHISQTECQKMYAVHKAQKADFTAELWAILTLNEWLIRNF